MERLTERYTKYYYPMLRIYQDDLERIVAILKENCDEVEIETEGYKLADIADLDQVQAQTHVETLSRFTATGKVRVPNTYQSTLLIVQMERGYIPRVTLTDASNTTLYGAATRIDAILRARQSKLNLVTSNWAVVVGEVICLAVIIVSLVQTIKLSPHAPRSAVVPWLVIVLLAGVLAVAMPFAAEWIRVQYRFIVYLTDSHTQRKLTREQRTRLINGGVGFLLGVLGTVIGGLIVWALTRP